MPPRLQLKSERHEGKTSMGLTIEQPCVTPQEYLERESRAETKSEYSSGVITPMAGATKEHVRINFDTSIHLGNQLRGGSSEAFGSDMRTRVLRGDNYYYPDLIIVCGEARFEDNKFDTLMNPTLIVEILSASSEHKDRNEKMDADETLGSLTDYVLISRTEPRIEHYSRLLDGGWRYLVARGRDAVLPLPNIGCELRLAEVSLRVPFETSPIVEMQPTGNQGQ